MLIDIDEINRKLRIRLQGSLDKGVPIVYSDPNFTAEGEMIKEFSDGRRLVFKNEGGKEILIREIESLRQPRTPLNEK